MLELEPSNGDECSIQDWISRLNAVFQTDRRAVVENAFFSTNGTEDEVSVDQPIGRGHNRGDPHELISCDKIEIIRKTSSQATS